MVHDEEIVAAKNTFSGFVSLMTWGTIGSVIAAAVVVMIIA
jgi:hypothetical protein